VVDGTESRGYEIVEDHWPVADLVFSRTGRHVAYKVRREGQNYLVVDGKEFGPYEDAVADEAGTVQGIWDFNFTDDEGYFSYRAQTGGGLVACRGWFRDGSISLTTSKEYESIGAGGPVWLRGASGDDGHYFAFAAREDGKDFIALLPEPPENKGKEPKLYDQIRPGSLACAPNRSLGFVAREGADTWRTIIGSPMEGPQGGDEWPPGEAVGELMHAPEGGRWASPAKIGSDIVMLVDGEEGPPFPAIVYPETVFLAGDHRVVYVAVEDAHSRVVVEGEIGAPYPQIDAGSILFDPRGERIAYVAGDGRKRFMVLDGEEQPAFDWVWNPRFNPAREGFAYCARKGSETYLVVDGKPVGPYEDIAPGSPVFSPDGLTVAWAAMGADGAWRVYVNGKAGPPFDSIVSRLTFAPGSAGPVYVARILSQGKYSFAMVSEAGVGRSYTTIWMGDGGRLFPRDDDRVEYFARQGAIAYRDTHPVTGPRLFLSDVDYENATTGRKERPEYDRPIEGNHFSLGGIRYSKGIGVCAPSEITYKLDAIQQKLGGSGPLRFTAVVGIDDGERRGEGTVRCSVYADGNKLASTPLLRRDRIYRFDVAIPPDAVTLRLVTSGVGDGKDLDWCNWIEAAVQTGEATPSLRPAARVHLPARWAWMEGDGIRYNAHKAEGLWLADDQGQARWDFLCPSDGTYEVFVSYACLPAGAGSEYAVEVGNQSFSGKAEETGNWNEFKRFSVGEVSLKKGEMYDVAVRLTKLVEHGVNVYSVELDKKEKE